MRKTRGWMSKKKIQSLPKKFELLRMGDDPNCHSSLTSRFLASALQIVTHETGRRDREPSTSWIEGQNPPNRRFSALSLPHPRRPQTATAAVWAAYSWWSSSASSPPRGPSRCFSSPPRPPHPHLYASVQRRRCRCERRRGNSRPQRRRSGEADEAG